MSERRDVVVVGGGPAGYVAGIRLAQLGKRVAVVERERVGGVCLNWGCIPVKALLHVAETSRRVAESRRLGLAFGPLELDFVQLYAWKGRVVDRLVRGVEYLLKANGVELVRGDARFTGPATLTVTTPDGEQELAADALVIATGSKPKTIPGLEPDGRRVLDSAAVLRLVELPGRMAVIGAGVVGLEFATVFSRLGSKVTVLELEDRVLPGIDAELASGIERLMKREGIEFRLGARVGEPVRGDAVTVPYTVGDEEQSLEADRVLVAVGRQALTDGLGLEAAGVETEMDGFVKVDADFRTSADGVHAIGDVKGGELLAHKAMAEGIALAELLGGSPKPRRFRAMPSCVYTDPEVAVVGMTEQEAKRRGKQVRVSRVPLNAVGRSLTLGRSEGFCKMVVDAKTDRVLGVGLLGPQADVLIAEAAVAVELGLTAEKLGRVAHPHPTMSELLFEAAEAIHGRAIHIANK